MPVVVAEAHGKPRCQEAVAWVAAAMVLAATTPAVLQEHQIPAAEVEEALEAVAVEPVEMAEAA
jgi:hypothetical protein